MFRSRVQIQQIVRVGRGVELQTFKSELGNVKPLLHSSSPNNFVGILSRWEQLILSFVSYLIHCKKMDFKLNPHRQNSSVKQSIQRLSSSHRAVVVWMSSGCCSHPPWAGRRVAWTTSQERGAVGNWNTLAAATKYLDESGSQWRWPRGQSCLETSW